MDDYNRGGRLIDNDEQGIIQVGLNHHTLPIAFLRPPEKRLFPPTNRYLYNFRTCKKLMQALEYLADINLNYTGG